MDNADGIKALLDKLKSSQAWQEAIAAPDLPPPPPAPAPPGSRGDTSPQPSVASLLAQLAGTSTGYLPPPPSAAESRPSEVASLDRPPAPEIGPPQTSVGSEKHDLHAFSFQQTLTHLAQLSTKAGFTESIRQIQSEQSALESQLWDERLAMKQRHQEKVKVAVTKANLIGSGGLSQFEADTLAQTYEKELHKFDTQRVIVAWDALISKQQAVMESLGVPGMFVSNLTSDAEKQQRVVRVLESIVNGPD